VEIKDVKKVEIVVEMLETTGVIRRVEIIKNVVIREKEGQKITLRALNPNKKIKYIDITTSYAFPK